MAEVLDIADGPAAAAAALEVRLAAAGSLEARLGTLASAIQGRIAFSTSLGLEDQAILHAIAATRAPVDVFTLDTGRHFSETMETLDLSEQRYGLRIRVVAPEAAEVE